MTVFATINGTIKTHAVITENCIPAQQVVLAYFYSVIPKLYFMEDGSMWHRKCS